MKQVKIIDTLGIKMNQDRSKFLGEKINEFLSEHPLYRIIDIKLSTVDSPPVIYTALIIYE